MPDVPPVSAEGAMERVGEVGEVGPRERALARAEEAEVVPAAAEKGAPLEEEEAAPRLEEREWAVLGAASLDCCPALREGGVEDSAPLMGTPVSQLTSCDMRERGLSLPVATAAVGGEEEGLLLLRGTARRGEGRGTMTPPDTAPAPAPSAPAAPPSPCLSPSREAAKTARYSSTRRCRRTSIGSTGRRSLPAGEGAAPTGAGDSRGTPRLRWSSVCCMREDAALACTDARDRARTSS